MRPLFIDIIMYKSIIRDGDFRNKAKYENDTHTYESPERFFSMSFCAAINFRSDRFAPMSIPVLRLVWVQCAQTVKFLSDDFHIKSFISSYINGKGKVSPLQKFGHLKPYFLP